VALFCPPAKRRAADLLGGMREAGRDPILSLARDGGQRLRQENGRRKRVGNCLAIHISRKKGGTEVLA